MQDIRFALRQFVNSPGFSAIAVLTLAVGIGACTAIFSIVNGLLLRPLPFAESERLMVVQESKPPELPEFAVAPGQFVEWRKQSKSFDNLAAMSGESYNLTGMGDPVRLSALRVTANTFSMLGVRPFMGRDFSASDDVPGKENVVILSHGFWVRQFGSRLDVVKQSVQLNGQTFAVIGIMPKEFQIEESVDIFTPLALSPEDEQNHGMHSLRVVGRLGDGATLERVRSEMKVISERLAKQFPKTNEGWGVKVTPMLESTIGDVRPVLFSLLGAVAFLLLIACVNVANLLLARATVRSKEIALRAALGANRRRIVRQLVTESLVLAVVGAGLGVFIAHWGLRALLAFGPDALPRANEIAIDMRTLAFAGALALATGVAFGVVPALHATRVDLNEVLKEGARGTGDSSHRLRDALVVAAVAVAIVLLAGAGLMIRSFARLQSVDPGFRRENAIAIDLSLSPEKYATESQQAAFVEQAIKSLSSLPGVVSVGATQSLPFSGSGMATRLRVADREEGREPPPTNFYAVTPDYFKSMGIRLEHGRLFEAKDGVGGAPVAIVNASLAKQLFPGQDPIGKRITAAGAKTWREIVGVVGDVKQDRLDGEAPLQTYEPFVQHPFDSMSFTVRYAGVAPGLLSAARAAIFAVDKDQPIGSIRPLADLVAESIGRQRFSVFLFSIFSGVALMLAAMGIYGVVAYNASRRTAEIGIRIALGARTSDVLRLMFIQASRLMILGVGGGLLGALLLANSLRAMIFGVSVYDPVAFASSALTLALVATVACLIPSLRAAKTDPLTALRAL